mgnify:CR=1 FL=1
MKQDEAEFLDLLLDYHNHQPYGNSIQGDLLADALAEKMGMCSKRAHYLLDKWSDCNLWEYGVSLRAGWFTQEGIDEIKRRERKR